MTRIDFLKFLALLPLGAGSIMKNRLDDVLSNSTSEQKVMPAFFLGHGSPMNAIEVNDFTRTWNKLGEELPKPAAILAVSAHWETRGTYVTAMERPKTIHDFGGFPMELFEVEYPAPGSKELALETKSIVKSTEVIPDYSAWGLDHGTWSIIKHIYPKADVPVFQLSINHSKDLRWHYDLASELKELRKKGVLIIGSGNIVHNLRLLNWRDENAEYDWAKELNDKVKSATLTRNDEALINPQGFGKEFLMASPTLDHYIPLLYALGSTDKSENISILNDKIQMGSLSMTSFRIG